MNNREEQLAVHGTEGFEGRHYAGRGDLEYISLLDISRRMFEPDRNFRT